MQTMEKLAFAYNSSWLKVNKAVNGAMRYSCLEENNVLY
jgi:hypothetical protein